MRNLGAVRPGGTYLFDSIGGVPIPEPGTLELLLVALTLGLGVFLVRR
ncbi:PEP-CTERM sorting domain-containing protein [Planctomycetota bacterium]